MSPSKGEIQDYLSELEDIELSTEDNFDNTSMPDVTVIDDRKSRNLDPVSIYLRDVKGTYLIDKEQEFWFGICVLTGKLIEEGLHKDSDETCGKKSLLNYLLKKLSDDFCVIDEYCGVSEAIKVDLGELFTESQLIRSENFIDNSSYTLNLIYQNKIFKDENWKVISEKCVDILACLNALPLDIFARISVWIFAKEINKNDFPDLLNFSMDQDLTHWDLEIISIRLFRAKENFIRANLRLVIHQARKFLGRGLPFSDLIQSGNEGLLHAIDKYDPSKGYRFTTYAFNWIRQRIGREILNSSRLIRIPVHRYEDYSKINRVEKKLFQELGRNPTDKELANELDGFTIEKVRKIKEYFIFPTSLDDFVNDDVDLRITAFIPNPSTLDPLELATQENTHHFLDSIISELLTEREKDILLYRFGFVDGETWTLQEIADEMHVSRERIRQIEDKVLRKLYSPLQKKKFSDFL